MNLHGKTIVVTGAAGGIGAALARAAKARGAKHVAIADIDAAGAQKVAAEIGGSGFGCDVTREDNIRSLVDQVEKASGPIEIFFSNAGILREDRDWNNAASASNADWEQSWAIHVMAHVYAARVMIPRMIERKGGYLVNTVSAAGVLSRIGSGPYSTTKHAALGFAEHLAITHKDDGIKVSIVCPQAVETAMLSATDTATSNRDGILSADAVAEATMAGIEAEKFLILPHENVASYMARKLENYDRWIGGMAKLRRSLRP